MNQARLIYRNVTRNGFRSGVVFCAALLLAALPFGVTFITEGGRAGLQVVLSRLGADLLIVPEGAEIKVETALLMGKPAQAWMPRQNLAKIGRLPGVAQVSPQLHLATLEGAACCSASEMFIVAFDPATDFTLRPWLDRQQGGALGPDEVLGGSQVSVPVGKTNIFVTAARSGLRGISRHRAPGWTRLYS